MPKQDRFGQRPAQNKPSRVSDSSRTTKKISCTWIFFAVSCVLSLTSRFWANKDLPLQPSQSIQNTLKRFGAADHQLPSTYILSPRKLSNRLIAPPSASSRDITAIVLNWARFPNVKVISASLCGPDLADIIQEVVIWNNSPNQFDNKELEDTGCPESKLRVYNSPHNVYFEARFLACAQAKTEYCFIQDDDYLVRPSIIRALSLLAHLQPNSPVYLHPPHEHLHTTSRAVGSQAGIHTSFAWLGYGSIIPRASAIEFLDLMEHHLNVLEDEMRMADNYFSILKNELPRVVVDAGISLGGGNDFTAGSEGDDRNLRYHLKAARYLDEILDSESKRLTVQHPFVSLRSNPYMPHETLAACTFSSCLLGTNIALVPASNNTAHRTADMFDLERASVTAMGEPFVQSYIKHALSNAVDGRTETAFQSPYPGKWNDYLALDYLADLVLPSPRLELVLLVMVEMEALLQACSLEILKNGVWIASSISQNVLCTLVEATRNVNAPLKECSFRVDDSIGISAVRIILRKDLEVKWMVYEMWLRTSAPLALP